VWVEPDVDQLELPREPTAGANSSPGLSATNVTVRSAASTSGEAAPVRPSTPLGMSTARTCAPPTSGACHVPRNPVPNAASTTRSDGGSVRGQLWVSNTRTFTPARVEQARSDAAVRAVVARPRDDVHGAAVRPAEHPDRSSRNGCAPARSIKHLHRIRRPRIDDAHLLRASGSAAILRRA
jgi:hypothetical protein